MAQGEQHHSPFRVGTKHDVAGQHELAEIRQSERLRELQRLLRVELAPAGLGVEESGGSTTCGREGQEASSLDQFGLQPLEARSRPGILLDRSACGCRLRFDLTPANG